MQFKFLMPTKVIFGKNCVRNYEGNFAQFGKKAMIVTGKNSGKYSGALDDVVAALNEQGIEYLIFDDIENNPSLENVAIAGKTASEFRADFIIGIGGGSPLDASKAIAVLAVNEIEPVELYKNVFANKPLPLIAIPTTAGTGSEVTPYSILTRRDLETKMSFGNEDTFPKIAFLDAKYTESQPDGVTVNTAVDTLSHAIEGYLCRKSTPASDLFAVDAVRIFGESIENLKNVRFDIEQRERLLYMAMLGGMVIAHTGTTIVHGLGYPLTYFKGIPHGKANGMLLERYLKYNYSQAKGKIDTVLSLLKMKSIDEFGQTMGMLLNGTLSLSEEEMQRFAAQTMKQRSTLNNIREVAEPDLVEILKKSMRNKGEGIYK